MLMHDTIAPLVAATTMWWYGAISSVVTGITMWPYDTMIVLLSHMVELIV